MGAPQGRDERVRKTLPPPSFEPQTAQPVAIRYKKYAIVTAIFNGQRDKL